MIRNENLRLHRLERSAVDATKRRVERRNKTETKDAKIGAICVSPVEPVEKGRNCQHCDFKHRFKGCPARGKYCYNCGRLGHYHRCCGASNKDRSTKEKRRTTDINKKNKRGETLLHCACIKLNLDKAESLVRDGADPNTRDNFGWTPLHEVVQRNHLDLLRLLLDAGANPNVPGGDEKITPLQGAIDANFIDVVKLLIERGANKNQPRFRSKNDALVKKGVLKRLNIPQTFSNHQLVKNRQGSNKRFLKRLGPRIS